ncbi:MAG TPA: tetratricopeptide repeat protein [Candidatus Thermoplasmatota archaeon]
MTPRNIALRTRLALALQMQGQSAQLRAAWIEYTEIMEDPRTNFAPGVWLMAARTAGALGKYAEAVKVLEQFATFLPGDDSFWDLLGECRERAAGRGSYEESPKKTGRGWEHVGSDWERVD